MPSCHSVANLYLITSSKMFYNHNNKRSNKMKTKKQLYEEKLIKLVRDREQALKEKDWLKAADLEIRIEATEAKIDRL